MCVYIYIYVKFHPKNLDLGLAIFQKFFFFFFSLTKIIYFSGGTCEYRGIQIKEREGKIRGQKCGKYK